MDSKLAYPSLLLEVHGAEIPQARVPARRIIEALDIIEQIEPPRSEDSFGDFNDADGNNPPDFDDKVPF